MKHSEEAKRSMSRGVIIIILLAVTVVIGAAYFLTHLPKKMDEVDDYVYDGTNPTILTGSFIQQDLSDSFNDEGWQQELGYMKAVGMDHIILQWSADTMGKTTIYPTELEGFTQNSNNDILENALKNATKADMDVYVGLQTNAEWFEHGTGKKSWLKQEAEYSVLLAKEIWAKYGHHESFAGWYLGFEMDNANHRSKTRWNRIVDYYNTVTTTLRKLSADKPVMIAPFFNEKIGLSPEKWQEMWTHILGKADIDILALQDGIGAGHVTHETLHTWYFRTANAVKSTDGRTVLWADVETFTPDFEPMEVSEVVRSMQIAMPYVERCTSFSFNHYMSPVKVDKEIYAEYRDYVKQEGASAEGSAD